MSINLGVPTQFQTPRVPYKWEQWQSEPFHAYTLTYGEDFTITPANMSITLHNRARKTGMRVVTKQNVGSVKFCFYHKSGPKPLI